MRLFMLFIVGCFTSGSNYLQAASIRGSSVVDTKTPLAVYFLHMRKCGGSSVGRYLRDWLTSSGCCPSTAPCKPAPYWMASPNDAAGWQCQGTGGNATIHFREDEYHCLAGAFAQRVPNVVPAVRVLSVTILRHPIDRLLSQWWYHGGPGHRLLQELVAVHCRSKAKNGTSASTMATAATVASAAASAVGRSQFYGQAVVEQHKGAACYQAAVKQARARSRAEDEGAAWWAEAWLDKDPPRAHLFRSLHAQYLPNYAVHRLAAEPGGYAQPQTEVRGATSTSNTVEKAAIIGEGHSSDGGFDESGSAEAVESLTALRRRCNLRGSKSISTSDYELALQALKTFDVVLIMEWINSSDSERASNSGASALISERADAMVGLLRNFLGDLAPATLDHARAGVASATPAPPYLGSSHPNEHLATTELWSLDGRGDTWRRQHIPASILSRLTGENYFDLELYRTAGTLVRSRAQSSINRLR